MRQSSEARGMPSSSVSRPRRTRLFGEGPCVTGLQGDNPVEIGYCRVILLLADIVVAALEQNLYVIRIELKKGCVVIDGEIVVDIAICCGPFSQSLPTPLFGFRR
jgi:hypothetical protein